MDTIIRLTSAELSYLTATLHMLERAVKARHLDDSWLKWRGDVDVFHILHEKLNYAYEEYGEDE